MKILWVEEDWENNVTTAMLKSWVRKEQIILIAHFELHYFLLTLWILDEFW